MGDTAAFHPHPSRVFVSSVFRGMADLRNLVEEACEGLGFHAVLTEKVAHPHGSIAGFLDSEIVNCDTYVGLFARSRGTVPTGDRWAITEQEYLRASELGLRRLVFVEDIPDSQRDPQLVAFLDEHVHGYRTGVYAVRYADEASLRARLTASLSLLGPQVVLAICGNRARLCLDGVRPAWDGTPEDLAEFPFDPRLDQQAQATWRSFVASGADRGRIDDASLRLVGLALWEKLAAGPRVALQRIVDFYARGRRPLLLRVRSDDHDVLALPWELLSTASAEFPVRDGAVEIVREVPAAGRVMLADEDPAPEWPRDRFDVLGFTADPNQDQTESVGLGNESTRDDSSLFWEREQESLMLAMEPMLRDGRGRLVLPDTGDADELRAELAREDRPGIVHLSCHGGTAPRGEALVQALFLEDADGDRRAVDGADMLAWIRQRADRLPSLLVLSACYTAAAAVGGDRTGRGAGATSVGPRPLAEELVVQALPRVLGMQSSVSDHGATEMAAAFYQAIAAGHDLTIAMRAGRLALRNGGLRHEWAIPVLLQRPSQPGPLVVPPREQASADAPFRTARSQFELGGVSYLDRGYIGRRVYERRLARAWRDRVRLLLIHGFGGIGKSTIAARFLERRLAEGVRVVILKPGVRSAATLFDDVAERLAVTRPSGGDPRADEQAFRDALRAALRQQRTVILFDNFEDNQHEGTQAIQPPELGRRLYELAQLGGETLCLLFTTRYPFAHPDGVAPLAKQDLDLGAFSRAESRKFKIDREPLRRIDRETWERILDMIGGHPKALDLLSGYLAEAPDRLAQLVEDLDQAVRQVVADLARQQERGRALLVEQVVAAVPAEHVPALDRLALIQAPLPTAELEALLAADGIERPRHSIAELRRRGLLAGTVSPASGQPADAVHRLVATHRAEALEIDRRVAFLARVGEHLRDRPGSVADLPLAARHFEAAGNVAAAVDCHARWASALQRGHAYAACLEVARDARARYPESDHDAIVPHAGLRFAEMQALQMLGDGAEALAALGAAESLLALLPLDEALEQRGRHAALKGRLANTRGDLETAKRSAANARQLFLKCGMVREAAVAAGQLADVLYARGELDEALRIRREEELPVYEKLGDVRERAVTLGKIADVLDARGELDEALRIRR
ncbi:MAG: CHAT domain-containing protein, partial [Planctomycetes bacterium]|nr:CHAT domain-containing protein [Planctomycetota bacterium]